MTWYSYIDSAEEKFIKVKGKVAEEVGSEAANKEREALYYLDKSLVCLSSASKLMFDRHLNYGTTVAASIFAAFMFITANVVSPVVSLPLICTVLIALTVIVVVSVLKIRSANRLYNWAKRIFVNAGTVYKSTVYETDLVQYNALIEMLLNKGVDTCDWTVKSGGTLMDLSANTAVDLNTAKMKKLYGNLRK